VSRASTHAGIFFFLVALLALPLAQAQTAGAKKFPIKIIYSALTASNAPVWVAGDQGLYDKYGLDARSCTAAALRRFKRSPAVRWS
jgi:hypothetical protein